MENSDYEAKHNILVRELAPECTLFLKRDGSFPLSAPCRVALFGNGARDTLRGGTGSGDVNSRNSVSIEEGLAEGGFEVTSKKWLDAYSELKAERRKAWLKELRRGVKGIRGIAVLMGAIMPEPDYDLPIDYDGDAAIYVLSRISGEGSDRKPVRGDIKLTETEVRDILALNSRFDRFLLVLNVGGPVDLSEIMEVRNILLLSQVGALAGNILSDIILGISCPSGKLTTTWSSVDDYQNIGDFGDKDETHYKEGIYVGYRYFDSIGRKPLFPFGFGLSYTRFGIECKGFSVDGTVVNVTAKVENLGSFKGKEVVQLYVSIPSGRLDQPYQILAAFTKTRSLDKGECTDVNVSFDLADIASYNSSKESYILEKGDYVLRLGNSSQSNSVIGIVSISGDATVRKARNVLGDSGFEDWRPASVPAVEILDGTPVIDVDASVFETVVTRYDREYEIDPFIHGLSDEELCHINIGRYSKGPLSVIGNASRKVAGAAGDFTDVLVPKGFPQITMADGPAGLRLNRKYFIDKDGSAVGIGNDAIQILADFIPGFLIKLISLMGKKPKRNQPVHEQYCTMIPIGTAVAQSFDVELARKLGDMIGSEMDRFRVDIWLAPALNIHRDIRCGRNFEYYSEDPLLSGKIAAAITAGVQSHPGRSVTVKHYAANNQETNRYGSNSNVSERAMRDIYLKGFGIVVRESDPKYVMTSYNLLNGVHTAEHRGLIENVRRDEYGFDGVVMTDWIVGGMQGMGKYGGPVSTNIAKAGGDVMMPGSENDYKTLLEGLRNGSVSRKQLEINATRMYRLARMLAEAQRSLD
ncbi:MAG: glycoside hydrolase family 3 protein [Spirochaetales bacterium]|nr:glycoside hydrolase family 3 protein [Spirochaetales bacterium]